MKAILICCCLIALAVCQPLADKGDLTLPCDQLKEKCPPGKVWSPLYEGGTCICPKPLDELAFKDDKSFLSVHWDVVACAYIPDCPDDYIWNPLQNRCNCRIKLDCLLDCKAKCVAGDEVCVAACASLVWDPIKCRCAKKCSNDVQCIAGTHFDQDQCKCVRNRCPVNIPCPKGSYFGEDCLCVYGKCPSYKYNCNAGSCDVCKKGEQFDQSICACVPQDRCVEEKCENYQRWDSYKCECIDRAPCDCKLSCAYGEHPNFVECKCEPFNTCYQQECCKAGEIFDHLRCRCVTDKCIRHYDSKGLVCAPDEIFDPVACKCIPDGCANWPANLYYNYTLGLCQRTPCSVGSRKPYCNGYPKQDGYLKQDSYGYVDKFLYNRNCNTTCLDPLCQGLSDCPGNFARNDDCLCSPKVCVWKECSKGRVFDPRTCECAKCPILKCDGCHFDENSCQCVCNPNKRCPDGYHKNSGDCCVPNDCPANQIWSYTLNGCVCDPAVVVDCPFGFDDQTCVCRAIPIVCIPRDCGINGWQDESTCCCICDIGYHFNDSLPLGPRCVKDFCVQEGPCQVGYVFNADFCQCVPSVCPLAPVECAPNFLDTQLCRCYCPPGKYFDTDVNCCVCIPKECPDGFIQDFNSPTCGCIPEVCPLLDDPRPPRNITSRPGWYGGRKHGGCASWKRHSYKRYPQKCRKEFSFPCEPGFVYNEYTCRCQKDNVCCERPCLLENSVFDQRVCQCQCRDRTCDGGIFNAATCQCECPPRQVAIDGICFCANNTVYNPLTNDCECIAINCTAPLTQNPLTCGCGCDLTCIPPHVLSPIEGVCACTCPVTLEQLGACVNSGGIYDPTNCQCICPLNSVFNEDTGACEPCVQNILCPPGTHFDFNISCGCVPNFCAGIVCPPGLQLNQVTCGCVAPCTNICPVGTTRDNQTCFCVPTPDPCLGLVCPDPLVLNATSCTCIDACPGVSRVCPLGFAFNETSCSCAVACGGATCPISGIPGVYDYTICACRRDCTNLAPCADACLVRNPLDNCNCASSLCAQPGPAVVCDNSLGLYYNSATCSCYFNACLGVVCPEGQLPDSTNSCLCQSAV